MRLIQGAKNREPLNVLMLLDRLIGGIITLFATSIYKAFSNW